MSAEQEKKPHLPVLYQQVLETLQPKNAGRYIDATAGAGGHSRGILEISAPDGELLALDVDPLAIQIAGKNLAEFGKRVHLVQASYTSIREQAKSLGWEDVDGILIDLGISSMQIDLPEKGFSFKFDSPLDMRFNPLQELTAEKLINTLAEEELADVLWKYGEEKQSRRIARAICQARPLKTTKELAEVITRVVHQKKSNIHPATKSFQAIRITVNDELGSLENFLPQALELLKPGGRLAVISFHSLEDRLTKHFFQKESRDCLCPPEQPICNCGHKASIKLISRKAISAEEEELKVNPRARSARLRVVEKL